MGTIAVLTDEYFGFRKLLTDQIASVAADAGYMTLCVTGRELDPAASFHESYQACNSIYSAIHNYQIDGIILLLGTINNGATSQRLQSFANSFSNIPTVSYGIAPGNLPSVIIDETAATQQMYEHVISQNETTKLAFIRGTENDPFSRFREHCFREVAYRHGYQPTDIYALSGNYLPADTYDAVIQLLQSHENVGVIAAANDVMAESAIHAINSCNLKIPADVAVTGYDDTREAKRSVPAISTIRQPLLESATSCAELLLKTIDKKQRSSTSALIEQTTIRMDAEFVVRGSTDQCQLSSRSSELSAASVLSHFQDALKGIPLPEGVLIEELSDALWKSISNGSDSICVCLEQHMANSKLTSQNMHWWNTVCHHLDQISTNLRGDTRKNQAGIVVAAAIASVRRCTTALSMDKEFNKRRHSIIRSTMQLQMSSCTREKEILDTMGRWLDQTKIERCYLVRYVNPGPSPDIYAQLLYVYENGTVEDTGLEYFNSDELLPKPYKQSDSTSLLVQSPINAGDMLFGYLLVDPCGLDNLHLNTATQSIGNALRNLHLITQLELQAKDLKSKNENLVKLANYDELTGLPNRLRFGTSLKEYLEKHRSVHQSVALMFIDLDGFKLINDTLGHRAGDALLRVVAQRLQTIVAASSCQHVSIARLGGDEFTIIVPHVTNTDMVDTLSREVLHELAKPYTITKHTVNVSASIGMARYPTDANDVETLIKNADSAMYLAKDRGKNRAAWYSADLDTVSSTVLQLDNDMRKALENGDIRMHYQPRVNLDTGKVCAVEALMRWMEDTPEGLRIISQPDKFISVAEKTGYIIQLDTFALDAACKQARMWELAGTPLTVAVNISVLHLQQDNVVNTVLSALKRHEVAPHLLELEITESAMMTRIENNIEKLQLLRAHGVQLSIDNFGTGYSSLSYLKQLPVNNLKIDRSFIADIVDKKMLRSADAPIVKSVIALGRSMDFHIIAVGVETEPQRQFLRALGCHQSQGFLFSQPMPAEEVSKLLDELEPKSAQIRRA